MQLMVTRKFHLVAVIFFAYNVIIGYIDIYYEEEVVLIVSF